MKDSDQRIVNSGYMAWTVIIFVFLGLSFKDKYGVEFCYPGTIMLILRQIVRVLDFENTKQVMGKENWNIIFTNQIAFCSFFIPIVSIMFGNRKYNKFVTSTCLFICVVIPNIGDDLFVKIKKSGAATFVFYIVGYLFLLGSNLLIGRHIPTIFDLLMK